MDRLMYPRYPENVDGDFYTVGTLESGANCLDCGLPEAEAPELLAPMGDEHYDTYFIKQPESDEEVEKAIWACKVCCTDALRYSGKDKAILKKLGEEYCDYKVDENDDVVVNIIKTTKEELSSKRSWWKFW